jgi:hypothetical protein
MKNKISTIAAICFAIVFFAACKKPSSQLALYVPADASVVLTIDIKTLTDKITSSGLSIDSLTNLFSNPIGESSLNWSDIKNSGISLDKPVYVFFKEMNTVQMGNVRNSAFMAEVNNTQKLEAFLKNKKPGKNILSADKYRYIALGDDYVAGWTDKILIVSQVTGGNEAPGNYGTGEGTLSQQLLTTLFTQKKPASIADADGFEDMLAKPGDVHFYTNNTPGIAMDKIPGLSAVQPLIKDSYTAGVVNFEKGKVTASVLTHYSKELANMLDKYPSKKINTDMISNYPDTLTGFVILSFNTGIITDLLHYAGVDNMTDGYTSTLGFTSRDVVNAFSGDIALLFSYNRSTAEQLALSHNISYLLNFGIADNALFNKVLNGLLDKQLLTKNGDQYRIGNTGGQGFVIERGNNNLFIASSDMLIKTYQSGSNKTPLPAGIEKQISNKSMAMYVDLNHFLNDAGAADTLTKVNPHDNYSMFSISQSAKQTFKDFIVTTDKGDSKTAQADMELNFVNTNENSLASLVRFISFAKADQLKNRNNSSGGSPDTSDDEENEHD